MADDAPPSFAELQARGVIPDAGASPPPAAPPDQAPAQAATQAASPPQASAPAPAAAGPAPTKTLATAQIGDLYLSGDGRTYKKIQSPYDPSGQAAIGVLQAPDGGSAAHPNVPHLHIIADPVTVTAAAAPAHAVQPQPSATGPQIVVDAPRGVRNNNLGNIKPAPGQTFPGQTGVDSGGFAQFDSPQSGSAAADTVLHAYGAQHGINTVQGVVQRWAPDAPSTYAPAVAATLGVKPTDPIDLGDPQVRSQIAQGIFSQEGNGHPTPAPTPGPPTDDTPPSFADLQARGVIPAAAPAPPPGLPQSPHGLNVGAILQGQNRNVGDMLNTATFGLEHRLNAGLAALPQAFNGPQAMQQAFSRQMDYQQAQQPTGLPHTLNTLAGGGVQALALPELKAAEVLPSVIANAPRFIQGVGRAAVGAGQGAMLSGAQAFGEARGDFGKMAKAMAPAMKIGAAVGAPLGALFGGRVGQLPQKTASMADYARAKVDPTLAVSGPDWAQRMATTIKGLPILGKPLSEVASRVTGQVNTGVQRAAGSLGSARDASQAGAALQRGAQAAVDALKKRSGELYAPVNALEKSKRLIPATRTQAALGGLADRFRSGPIAALMDKYEVRLPDMRAAIAGSGPFGRYGVGRVGFDELKALRTNVGKMMRDPQVLKDRNAADLAHVYAEMTEDLKAGAESLGGPQARRAFEAATAHESAMHQRIKDTLRPILKADRPEAAFDKVRAMMGSSSRADLDQLRRLTRTIPDSQRREFASGVINSLGRDAEGHFNPGRFIKQWGDLHPEAKRLVIGDDATVGDLDALYRVAQHQAGSTFLKSGGMGGHVASGAVMGELFMKFMEEMGGGHLTDLPRLAAHEAPAWLLAMGASGVGSHLLSSPGMARLFLGASRASTPQEEQAVLQSLRAYAQANPSLRGEVLNYGAELAKRFKANAPMTMGTAVATAQPRLAIGHSR